MRNLAIIAIIVMFAACGSGSDGFDPTVPSQSPPIITQVVPATASPGDTVSLYGSGFSNEAASNIVVFGTSTLSASTWEMLPTPVGDESEAITFTIPTDAAVGTFDIYVFVIDNPSNTNLTLTIN